MNLGDLKLPSLIMCNLSETTQMFNSGNIYHQHMTILLMMHPVDLSKIQRWFNGPAFLWSLEKTWFCDKQSIKPVNEDDPELKNKLQLNIVKADITVTSKLEIISTTWIRIRKIMAVILLATNISIKRITKPRPFEVTTLIHMTLLEKDQKMIFKMLQQHSFSHEISSLKSNTIIHRSSSLYKLDPFLDTDGVLRVGSRLKRSMLDINEVYPVILSNANLITEAIVTWCHENVAHSGRSMTLNNL